MLVQEISTPAQMRHEFEAHGRHSQFTWPAFEALHAYLWDLGEDLGEPIVFDVVGICCEWCEYDDAADLGKQFLRGTLADLVDPADIPDMDEDDIEAAYIEEMEQHGTLIQTSSGSVLFSE
jgi:hypothetical protein